MAESSAPWLFPRYFNVNVNDSADNADHTNVVISPTGITGLAPAPINFGSVSINTLTVRQPVCDHYQQQWQWQYHKHRQSCRYAGPDRQRDDQRCFRYRHC